MAQSYEIYLRDKTNGSKKPTQPKQSGSFNTAPKSESIKQDAAEKGLVTAAKVSNAGKVLLAVYAAAKVAKNAIDFIVPFVTRETGDYRFAVAWNNTWNTIGNFLNPGSYAIKQINYYQENMIINKRQEQQRLLVGDAYINSISRKS